MPNIHPTAIVSPEVTLADDVVIGPFCILDGLVRIGGGTVVQGHSHINGKTVIGQNCKIGPAAYIGLPANHIHADPTVGQTILGDNVTARETVTIHRSITAGDAHATRVGNNVYLMAAAHVGHDCVVDDHVILANAVLLGGHVRVGARVFLGGGVTVHQNVRVGRLAIVGGNEVATQDVPPFAAMRSEGLRAYNAIGCRRAGLSRESIQAIRTAYTLLRSHRNTLTALTAIRQTVPLVPEVIELLTFYATTKRGVTRSIRRVGFDAVDTVVE